MIFGDVDAGLAEESSDTTDDAGNVSIAQDEERAARGHVDPERADSRYPPVGLAQERPSDPESAFTSLQTKLDLLPKILLHGCVFHRYQL
jgi:hypothetical protein